MPSILRHKAVNYVCWLGFILIIGYFKYGHHELWKDEWQAWFVAKDKSLMQIFSFLYYEGHPALWYLYLKIFTFFAGIIDTVTIIQTAHLITVAAGLYFLFVLFRLPLFFKILFALSYFLLFEYGLIDRGYFLVILLAFWSAWLLRQEQYSALQLGCVLFLLCQTEVYGVFMAVSFGIYILSGRKNMQVNLRQKDTTGLFLGLVVFVISVFPRTTGHVAKTRSKDLSFADNLLTSLQGNLSNTYLPGSTTDTFAYGWTVWGLIFSACCIIGLWYVFRNNKNLLATFGAFFIMMISFSVIFFLGGIRQWGMGFVFFISLLEIRNIDFRKEWLASLLLSISGFFNMIYGMKAMREEVRLPFTNAEKTGLFIKEKVPVRVPVVAINKFEATPVIGYAERKFYELPDGVEFSYFRWVDRIYLPSENELKLFGKFKGVGGIIVLSPKPLDTERYPSIQLWQKFDTLNYKKENYYIYTLTVR